MHLGHFALTEWLIKDQRDGSKELKVVNVASGVHHFCTFFGQGCIDDNFFTTGWREGANSASSYARAKLANVLHAAELPSRHSSLTAYSVDLGFVQTKIANHMSVFGIFGKLGWIRSASVGAKPVIEAVTDTGDIIQEGGVNGGIVDVALWRGHKAFELERRLGFKRAFVDSFFLRKKLWALSQKLTDCYDTYHEKGVPCR